ncbi:YihY/virulence factor BrkB family protein [Rubrimonas cliftonensis]|uniref:Membrane protein n=1 Tax=Rubrimonas cliftonensis TaxID=89524 RepID=A0A1H3VXU8_9RHOB|nr:YihY/virulence factor BrkB family protein [Rubrimonas cliftonensis]SDZ79511.1 membrane protein [Rubrimonas cliftonensis]
MTAADATLGDRARAFGRRVPALLRRLRMRLSWWWRGARLTFRAAIRAGHRFNEHDGAAMAGYIAYAGFLSIFPFAIFATALAGVMIGPERADEVMAAIFDLAPEHIAQTLEPVILGVTNTSGANLITFSALGAMWVASNALEAMRIAFDRAYEAPKPRAFVTRRLRAMGFVLLAALTFAIMGLLIVLAPLGLRVAEQTLGFRAPFGIGLVRYGLGVGVLAVFLFQLNLLLPSRRPVRQGLWPGVAVSGALVIAGATGLSVYLAYAPSYTVTYGAFAGVIVTLLFFYLVGAAIIFGAELNAALIGLRGETWRDGRGWR